MASFEPGSTGEEAAYPPSEQSHLFALCSICSHIGHRLLIKYAISQKCTKKQKKE